MTVFIHLYHGRDTSTEQMDDWGYEGPTLGPFTSVQVTYENHFKLYAEDGEQTDLTFEDGLVVHEGKFYGDFAISSEATL